ncbi:MAG: hypothetical protein PVG25_14075, partial [Anaerolineae bacterium]
FLPGGLSDLLAQHHLDLQLLHLAILILLGALTYLAAATLLRADELTTLAATLRRLVKARGS